MTEELFVKWVDGKLSSDEEKQLEVLIEADPSISDELESMKSLGQDLKSEIKSSVEPPYGDFFNSQLMRKVDLEVKSQQPAKKVERWWQSLRWAGAPAGALALVLAFFAGHRVSQPEEVDGMARSGENQDATEALPTVYFAGEVLDAEVIADSDGEVSVIVVNGLAAISDDIDFDTVTTSISLPDGYRAFEARRFQ